MLKKRGFWRTPSPDPPREPQEAPRKLQDGPKGAPREPQDGPNLALDGPKTALDELQEGPKTAL